MKEKRYGPKITAFVRIFLFLAGAGIGVAIVNAVFGVYGALVRAGMKAVFLVSGGLIFGLALLFTTTPIMRLSALIVDALKRFFAKRKPIEVVGYVIGVLLGLMITFVVAVLLAQFSPLRPLNIVITLLVAVLSCLPASMFCANFLMSKEPEETVLPQNHCGYILTSSAFFGEKLEKLCLDWLNGEIVVSALSVKEIVFQLRDQTENALKVYNRLQESGRLRTVETVRCETEREEVLRLAAVKHYKIIVDTLESAGQFGNSANVLPLEDI